MNLEKYSSIFITQYISGTNQVVNNYGTRVNSYQADLILAQIEDSNRYIVEKDRYGTLMGNIITLTEPLIAKLKLLGNIMIPAKEINLEN